ncbi:uncharacterized protein LOC111712267 [Eurytemora carolleeae]|uniref:uncharacterized protein LOC111712267 n=1 Tax=Eurytemora carolleeae TaxID=1294199 RepID=UPI000C780E52|nr:uncharacterized protein LOC111712267 [Eurytemora carolleeae]|eukprot:XP_023342607.1 uncharacterized protein LOC111712267 [Eurytemora affinis]
MVLCEDGSNADCSCKNPPCGIKGNRPSCSCDDGSIPKLRPLCNDGSYPQCPGACHDGADALIDESLTTKPCVDGSIVFLSKCRCEDGTKLRPHGVLGRLQVYNPDTDE